MTVNYPLKTTVSKHERRHRRTNEVEYVEWSATVQYAPRHGTNQDQYSIMNHCSHSFYAKTKEECKDWARKFKADKRHIKMRKEWRRWERYYAIKKNIENARKFGRALSQPT